MQDPSRLARRTSATDSLAGLRAEHAVTEPGSLHFTFRSSDPPICLCEFRLCGVLDSLFPPMTLSRPFSSFLVLSRPFSPFLAPPSPLTFSSLGSSGRARDSWCGATKSSLRFLLRSFFLRLRNQTSDRNGEQIGNKTENKLGTNHQRTASKTVEQREANS